MNKKYLNNTLKEKYNKDFNNNVINCEHKFWKLDDGLKDVLVNINKNEHIQTLYSKRPNFNKTLIHNHSYLIFAFTKSVENLILNNFLIKYYKESEFNDNEHDCPHLLNPKFTNSNSKNKKIKLDCLNNKTYFNINHLIVNYINNYEEKHEKFWKFLNDSLSEVKPSR